MKRWIVVTSVFMFLLTGCFGAPSAPDWLANTVGRLEQFKKELLGGREDVAEMNFSLAISEVKKSGDLDTLGRVYLTKMAVERALMLPMNDEEFLRIHAASPSPKNENYYHFCKVVGRGGRDAFATRVPFFGDAL